MRDRRWWLVDVDVPIPAKLTPRIVDERARYYEERRRLDLERIATLERENADLRRQIELGLAEERTLEEVGR